MSSLRAAVQIPLHLVLVLALASLAPAQTRDPRLIEEGRARFQRYCASCHGVSGRGDGPVAPALKRRPADLTQIRVRYGGRFPFSRLREFIDGRSDVAEHGPREMPVWGRVLQEGKNSEPGSEVRLSGEITELLAYLEAIQATPPARD